jgi:hypothetical protein
MAVDCGAAEIWQTFLPVHLTDFRYSMQSLFVNLFWTIEDQANVDHFELERSIINGSYEFVAAVPSNLSGEFTSSYTYPDSKPLIIDTKYRMKLVGKDGKSSYSGELLIHPDKTIPTSVNCYPNPMTDHLNLSTNFRKTTQVNIDLCNVSGIRLKNLHLTVPAGYCVSAINNLSGLSTGFYMIRISTDEKIYYQQVIKK